MKLTVSRFLAACCLGLTGALGSLPVIPAAAQSTEANNPAGTWLLDDGHYKVQVLPQAGGKWHAKIVALGAGVATKDVKNPDKALRTRNIMGTDLFWNLRWNPEERKFTDGTLYAPEHGKTIPATVCWKAPTPCACKAVC